MLHSIIISGPPAELHVKLHAALPTLGHPLSVEQALGATMLERAITVATIAVHLLPAIIVVSVLRFCRNGESHGGA